MEFMRAFSFLALGILVAPFCYASSGASSTAMYMSHLENILDSTWHVTTYPKTRPSRAIDSLLVTPWENTAERKCSNIVKMIDGATWFKLFDVLQPSQDAEGSLVELYPRLTACLLTSRIIPKGADFLHLKERAHIMFSMIARQRSRIYVDAKFEFSLISDILESMKVFGPFSAMSLIARAGMDDLFPLFMPKLDYAIQFARLAESPKDLASISRPKETLTPLLKLSHSKLSVMSLVKELYLSAIEFDNLALVKYLFSDFRQHIKSSSHTPQCRAALTRATSLEMLLFLKSQDCHLELHHVQEVPHLYSPAALRLASLHRPLFLCPDAINSSFIFGEEITIRTLEELSKTSLRPTMASFKDSAPSRKNLAWIFSLRPDLFPPTPETIIALHAKEDLEAIKYIFEKLIHFQTSSNQREYFIQCLNFVSANGKGLRVAALHDWFSERFMEFDHIPELTMEDVYAIVANCGFRFLDWYIPRANIAFEQAIISERLKSAALVGRHFAFLAKHGIVIRITDKLFAGFVYDFDLPAVKYAFEKNPKRIQSLKQDMFCTIIAKSGKSLKARRDFFEYLASVTSGTIPKIECHNRIDFNLLDEDLPLYQIAHKLKGWLPTAQQVRRAICNGEYEVFEWAYSASHGSIYPAHDMDLLTNLIRSNAILALRLLDKLIPLPLESPLLVEFAPHLRNGNIDLIQWFPRLRPLLDPAGKQPHYYQPLLKGIMTATDIHPVIYRWILRLD